MQEFRKQVQAPVSVEALFAWHERPGAFERLSPPWDRPKVLEHTGGIRDGAKVVLQVHAGPVPTTWTLEHRDYLANRQFRDVMREGPFAVWEHTHSFAPLDAHSSTLDDHIRYQLPLGGLGNAVAGGYTQRTLTRVFAYRHAVMLSDLARHASFADRPRLRIAITGASGFIGTQLTAFLSTGGHDVIRIGRSAPKPGSDDIQWNPERGQLDARGLEGIDAVIHLAGSSVASRWTTAHRASLKSSRVEGTSLLAHTLAQLSRKPRVLLSGSAIGIYGSRGDELLDEGSALGDDYLADVGRAWEASTAPAEKAGIRVVHLRTGIVQGAAGGALGTQGPLFRYGAGGTLGPGTQFVSSIALDDEIGAIHFCLMRDEIRGPVNLVAPTAVTNAEYTRVLGDVMSRPTIAHAPAFALRLLLGEEMANLTVLASQRVDPRVLREAGFEWRLPGLAQMLRFELGE
ncbi:TIGR01777 family oxidoreductase [Gemmatimonas sp.]|uniref:TIGR01777 family oxidoreductase n=1 Tax=Gemmatimonas sp. TaxID=1962908 RepID=UPI0035699C92